MDFPELHAFLKGDIELPILEDGYLYSGYGGSMYAVYRSDGFEYLGSEDGVVYNSYDIQNIPTNCMVYCYAESSLSWETIRELMKNLHCHNIDSIFMAYENKSGDDSSINAHQGIRAISRAETYNFMELRLLKNGEFEKIDSDRISTFSDPEELIGYLLELHQNNRELDVIISAESMVSTGDYLLFYNQVHQWIKWQTCLPLEKRKIDTRSVEQWIKNNAANQSLQPTVKTPVESGNEQGTAAEL